MKSNIALSIISLLTFSTFASAANLYITRGYDETKTAPLQWSDSTIWSTTNTKGYNTAATQAQALPTGLDTINGVQYSAQPGNSSVFSGILNVDIENATIAAYMQGGDNNVVDHLTGNTLNFQFNSVSQTILTQNRNLQGLTIDNNINIIYKLSDTGSLGTATITTSGNGRVGNMGVKRDFIINGNITADSIDNKRGSVYFKLTPGYRDQWTTTAPANNIYINGKIDNLNVTYGYDLGKKPTAELDIAKIYIGGNETNVTRYTTIQGGVEVVFAKTNGAYANSGGFRMMIYHGSKITYMGNQQLDYNVGLQFKTPVSEITNSTIGGILNLNGFSQNSSELHFYNDSGYLSSGVLAIIDFGEGSSLGNAQTFEVGKIWWDAANVWTNEEKGKLKLSETQVIFKNYELDSDAIIVREAMNDQAKSLIRFDGLGERDVDYSVLFGTDKDGYTTISYQLIPEASQIACMFGLIALAFVAFRRRK